MKKQNRKKWCTWKNIINTHIERTTIIEGKKRELNFILKCTRRTIICSEIIWSCFAIRRRNVQCVSGDAILLIFTKCSRFLSLFFFCDQIRQQYSRILVERGRRKLKIFPTIVRIPDPEATDICLKPNFCQQIPGGCTLSTSKHCSINSSWIRWTSVIRRTKYLTVTLGFWSLPLSIDSPQLLGRSLFRLETLLYTNKRNVLSSFMSISLFALIQSYGREKWRGFVMAAMSLNGPISWGRRRYNTI